VTDVLAVDPGGKYAGVALFRDGVLADVLLARHPSDDPHAVVKEIVDWVYGDPHTVITEGCQVYPGSKTNPNDLIPLSFMAGLVQASFPKASRRLRPLPRQWKGSVPKDIFAERIKSRLSPEEVLVLNTIKTKADRGHVLDAIGLGLFALDRL
jgi:hypothetical protein